MSYRSVCRWVAKFKADQQDLKVAAHSGRPPTTSTKSKVKKITDLLNQDDRSIHCEGSSTTGELFLTPGLRKINARWIAFL